jgi:short-subunit dehydrogenase
MFFNSLLIETKNPKLKVISIKPGVIKTPIWDKSVNECKKHIENLCEEGKYKKEFAFLMENACKNSQKGLCPEEVSSLVLKVLSVKNPKLSYTIGKDAKFGHFMSLLPQRAVNFIVKTGLRARIKD